MVLNGKVTTNNAEKHAAGQRETGVIEKKMTKVTYRAFKAILLELIMTIQ